MGARLAEKVLLIGWDAADWQIIEPMLSAGLLPSLDGLIRNGVMGNLATLKPVISPILWTSIATGKRADKHGILGFLEPRPDGCGVQPVSSTSRKSKAVWNILTQNGLRSNVVGWYASHPAEPIAGVCVSEHFARVQGRCEHPEPPPPGWIHPPQLAAELAELRLHPEELGAAHLAPFVPTIGDLQPHETPPVTGLRTVLARCASTHAAFTWLLEHQPWDFAAVYYEAIDHVCHAFMKYHPPKMPHISQELFDRYKGCVSGIYRFHDMMLERLLQLAGKDATVMIVSDHGFLNDHLRPVETSDRPVGPEGWHRHHGIFVLSGPGIRRDERIYGATILDIAPTILTLLGVAVGSDMDGKVLAQCFDQPPQVQHVESWDRVPGEAGMHPPDVRVDPFEQQAAIRQLIDLGYMQDPGTDTQKMVRHVINEARYNLASVHIEAGRVAQAANILEDLHGNDPADVRFALLLAQCCVLLDRRDQARRLIHSIANPGANAPQMQLLLATIDLAEGNSAEALRRLMLAEQAEPRLPNLHIQIGSVYARQRRWDDAQRAFRKAIEIDADAAMAHYGLGIVALHQRRDEQAAEHLLRAVGLMHYFPRAHFMLGVALSRLGWYDRAARAILVAVSMRPNMPIAHRYLAALYAKLGDADLALHHRRKAQHLLDLAREKQPLQTRSGVA